MILQENYQKHGYQKDEGGYFISSARNDYTDESVIELHQKGRVQVTRGGKLLIDYENKKVSVDKGKIRIKAYRELRNGYIVEVKTPDNVWIDIADIS